MLAYHVVIDVAGTPEAALERLRGQLRGDVGWASELMLPVRRVGAGPPDFLGRVTGRSFRLHATWRPSFDVAHKSPLEVIGLVEPRGATDTRVRALIRPRAVLYGWLSLLAIPVALVALNNGLVPELLIVPAVATLYWFSVVRHDMALTASGLEALLAPSTESRK